MKKVHLYTLSIGLGVLAFSIPLIAYGVNGAFMRYSGDDYCYAAVLSEYGFWEAQRRSYFEVTTYHGNRYSLTLFSHLADLFGPKANGGCRSSANPLGGFLVFRVSQSCSTVESAY